MKQLFTLSTADEVLLKLALTEDLSSERTDLTTDLLFMGKKISATARIINKQQSPIRISGLYLLEPLFMQLQEPCDIEYHCQDGDEIISGQPIVTLSANATTILRLERTLLNFLRHLSGIATLTAKFVDAVAATETKILDTRKTTPGMRRFEKYAVTCGGGFNHRFGLYDAIMVKDTHIDSLGGIEQALTQLRQQRPSCRVIIEVRNSIELEAVVRHGANWVDQVLLDNMSLTELSHCVAVAKPYFKTEASGNLSLATIGEVAKTGVDFASVGQVTHSAPQVDLAMRMELK